MEYENIIDIKCGAFHNLVKTERNEYFLWGRNKENQCLIKANNNDYDDKFNMEFIKRPTKYLYNKQNMEIINIYLGYKETKIVMKQIYDQNGDEIFNGNKIYSENDRNSLRSRKKSKLSKFSKFKAWCNKLKKSKKYNKKDDDKKKDWSNDNNLNDNNNKHLNGLENIYGLDDNKYHDREYDHINHQFKICKQYKNSCSSSIGFNSKRLESIEEIPEIESNDNHDTDSSMSDDKENYYCYYSPKMHNNNSIGNDIGYQPMTCNKS